MALRCVALQARSFEIQRSSEEVVAEEVVLNRRAVIGTDVGDQIEGAEALREESMRQAHRFRVERECAVTVKPVEEEWDFLAC